MTEECVEYVAASPAVQKLHPIHEACRLESYPDLSEDEFIRKVCHEAHVLPEKGTTPVVHVPCRSVTIPNADGWMPANVLVIAPNPVGCESLYSVALPTGIRNCVFLRDELKAAGIPLTDVSVTHAIRFLHPDGTAYSQAHKTSNAVFAREDVLHIRPKVIITLGAAAYRCLFGQKAKLDSVRGDVITFDGIPVVATASHLQFATGYGDIDVFRAELRRAAELLNGIRNVRPVDESGYRVIDSIEQLRQLEKDIVPDRFIAFDFEFGNDVAREEFNYPLSLQLSWAEGQAAFIKIREEFGAIKYSEAQMAELVDIVRRILSRTDCQLAGHHIRVDADVAHKMGIDIDDRVETGFDTMLAHHALYGDSSQGLDHVTRKYCPWFGAYWRQLEDWLDANERNKRLPFGYRDIPYSILIPYGLRDADVTWRAAVELQRELIENPGVYSYFKDIAMPAALHLLDVQRQGILVDEERRMAIRARLQPAYDEILGKLRKLIKWPDFNPGSKDQVAALLFSGTLYKNKKAAPAGAKVFDIKPLTNTDKYPKQWSEIEEEGAAERNTPCTKATVIETLYGQTKLEELKLLKQLSVLGKFLSTYLTPVQKNEFGVTTDGKGFHNAIGADGRVRTHLWQTSETGRLRSTAANLQTNPKKQEEAVQAAMVDLRLGMPLDEYRKRCKSAKCPPELLIPFEKRIVLDTFKSCYVAPEGSTLIEADFKTAEVCVWAYVSGDTGLLKLLEQKRDIHSEVAATAFQLPEAKGLADALAALDAGDSVPYKDWVAKFKVEREMLRIVAKACIAEGTPILTRERGWIPIEQVKLSDDVWDGWSWVSHEGVVFKGVRPVIDVQGVLMTDDHKVLTRGGWLPAQLAVKRQDLRDVGAYLNNGRLLLSEPDAPLPQDIPIAESKPSLCVRTYDIVNAGPRHRFQAGPLIVHNCLFGIMYSRGAPALAREMARLGVNADVAECQKIIDSIANAYPTAWEWIKENQAFAVANGYVATVFGNRRYFSGSTQLSESAQAGIRREAANGPIQSTVAMLALRAGINLYRTRYRTNIGRKIGFKVLLPIHDAFLVEVPTIYVKEMDMILKKCMSDMNQIPGTGRCLGVDIEHYQRWGEH
jgi:DNA polymerase I-like protein with 3'-5' exonuclease and polymerase domains